MNTDRHKFEFAADLETPVSAFLKLTPLHPVFLLESVEKNETVGRYSFIGILPKKYFLLENLDGASFLSGLQSCLSEIHTESRTRLAGGLIGFVSYQACAFLHPKVHLKPTTDPIAGFVLPSAILIFYHFNPK